jgi:Contractile injection system tape measure protein
MPNSLHRIRRVSWKVHTPSASEAFSLRATLRQGWQDLLVGWEEVFDTTIDQAPIDRGQDIHIPKIELNLVVDPGVDMLAVLPELLRQQLQEQLRLRLGPAVRSNGSRNLELSTSRTPSPLDLLLHYLQTGSVHWIMAHLAPTELAAELRQILSLHRAPLYQQLSSSSTTAPSYFRLFQLLPPAEQAEAVRVLVNNCPAVWRQELLTLLDFIGHEQGIYGRNYLRWHLLSAILAASFNAAAAGVRPDFPRIFSETFEQLGLNVQDFLELMPPPVAVRAIDHEIATPNSSSAANAAMDSTASDELLGSPASINFVNSEALDRQYTNISDSLSASSAADQWRPPEPSSSLFPEEQELRSEGNDSTPPQREFPRLVNHAGLILLHPFMVPFLTTVGLYEPEQQVIRPAQLPRAAALFHFLAAGPTEPYEYELGAIKILLGLEPETPLPMCSGLIEESDQRAAEILLASVLDHWSILKNTSIPGLRSSFLQRPGLLSRTPEGWRLQVERQSFDMLLDSLPWSISLIKLPWMKYLLYSEW